MTTDLMTDLIILASVVIASVAATVAVMQWRMSRMIESRVQVALDVYRQGQKWGSEMAFKAGQGRQPAAPDRSVAGNSITPQRENYRSSDPPKRWEPQQGQPRA